MTRQEVKIIKNKLEHILLKYSCIETKQEYPLCFNHEPHSIYKADVCGFFESNYPYMGDKNKINKGICIEFKSNHTDFLTGYGQNFNFEYNFFCTTKEMMKYAIKYIQKNYEFNTIGLIIYDSESDEFFNVMPAYLIYPNLNKITPYNVYRKYIFNKGIDLNLKNTIVDYD